MIIFYGTRRFTKILGEARINQCNNCGYSYPLQVLRVASWFTLFWIPIFPFSFKYFINCPTCNAGYRLKKQEALDAINQVVIG